MPSAIYKMKLHPFGILHSDRHRTFICFCRTFGIRNIYDFILCTMHDAHPAGVVLNFCKGIHLHDIHCIATPQFHQSAAESIWYGMGLVFGSFIGFTIGYFRIRWLERHLDEHIFCKGELFPAKNEPRPSSLVYKRETPKKRRRKKA